MTRRRNAVNPDPAALAFAKQCWQAQHQHHQSNCSMCKSAVFDVTASACFVSVALLREGKAAVSKLTAGQRDDYREWIYEQDPKE